MIIAFRGVESQENHRFITPSQGFSTDYILEWVNKETQSEIDLNARYGCDAQAFISHRGPLS
jgi:hypothetical protein